MNKETFNKLEVLDQIEYINNNLKNTSLTKLCKDIGIDRSTISKRFKSNNYIFDKIQNKYILSTKEIQNKYKSNTNKSATNKLQKDNNNNILDDKIKALESRIEGLEGIIKDLINKDNAAIKEDNEIGIKFYKEADTVRSYRIDYKVQQRFKEYCNKHNEYKIKDIISTALDEFLNRYDK